MFRDEQTFNEDSIIRHKYCTVLSRFLVIAPLVWAGSLKCFAVAVRVPRAARARITRKRARANRVTERE